MKKILALALTIAPALLYAQNAHQRMDFAAEKLMQKDTVGALAYYEQAERLEPRNPEVYATRAQLYIDMSNLKLAKSDLDKAVLLGGKKPKYYNRRATLYNISGYYDYVINDANKALEFAGDDRNEKNLAWYLRGEAKKALNNPEGAVADYDLALANNPEADIETGALLSSAEALGHLKRHKEAIARLEKLVAKYPDFLTAYNNLGYQYIQDSQYKKAVDIYDKLLPMMEKQDGDNYVMKNGSEVQIYTIDKAAPLNNRGFAKFKLSRNKEAIEDINASIKIEAQNPYAYKNRALVYLATKKQKEACADLQKALDLGFTKTYGNEVQQLMDEHCK